MAILLVLFTAIGLAYHVREEAPERGRSALAWILLVLVGCAAGIAFGAVCMSLLVVRAGLDSTVFALVLNPVISGCVAPVAVVVVLHRLPAARARLRGTAWAFDRLDTGERVVVRVAGGVSICSDAAERVVDPHAILGVRVDGECLVLELAGDEGARAIPLRPVGLPSRATRQRFVEAVGERVTATRA